MPKKISSFAKSLNALKAKTNKLSTSFKNASLVNEKMTTNEQKLATQVKELLALAKHQASELKSLKKKNKGLEILKEITYKKAEKDKKNEITKLQKLTSNMAKRFDKAVKQYENKGLVKQGKNDTGMMYLQIQVFKAFDEEAIRKEERAHKNFTKNIYILQPDDYIIVNGCHYIGHQSRLGISEVWQYVKVSIKDYNKFIKKPTIIYKGNKQTKAQYFQDTYGFIDSIESEDVREDILHKVESADCYIVLRGQQVIKKSMPIRDPELIDVAKAEKEKRMFNKYLQYVIDPQLEGLFKASKNFKSNCCLPDACLNLWAEKFNKTYKNKKLNYEVIKELVYNKPYQENDAMKMNFKQAKAIFRYVRQEAYLYNAKGKLLCHYHPKEDGLNIDTKFCSGDGLPLRMILQDEHVYLIDDVNARRSIALKEYVEQELKEPSKIYNQAKMSFLSMGTCLNIDEAINKALPIIKNTIDDDEVSRVEFLYINHGSTLKDVYLELLEKNYKAGVSIDRYGVIVKIFMKIGNVIITVSSLNFGNDTVITQNMLEMSEDEAFTYQELTSLLNFKFTDTYYRSTYSVNFKEVLRHYKRCPKTLTFNHDYDGEVVGIDCVKCYPAIVAKEIEYLPVFGKFDYFKEYDNGRIYDENIYLVKMKNNFPTENAYKVLINDTHEGSEDLVYGFILNEIIDFVEIVAVNTPYKIVKNKLSKEIIQVFASPLNEAMKKNMLVSAIGKWGTCYKTAEKSEIYETEEEAFRYKGDGDVIKVQEGLYITKETKKTGLINGFLPLQNLVYDKCRLKVYNYMKHLTVEVLAVKTDCVFIKKEDVNKINIPLKKDITGDLFINIGKFGLVENCSLPKVLPRFTPHEARPAIFQDIKNTTYHLNDEWKIDEVIEILQNTKKLIVLGDHAGTGKSYVLEEVIKQNKDKTHFIACPTNERALEWIEKGFNAGTYYDLCGMRLNDDKEIEKGTGNHNEQIIGLEEILQLNTYDLTMLYSYMEKHKETVYIANGDVIQNEPIDSINNTIDSRKYYNDIMNLMFDSKIILHIPKRYKKNVEAKEKAIQLKKDLFENNMSNKDVLLKYASKICKENINKNYKCVTYLQDTRRILNDYIHFQNNSNKYFVGLELKANTRMMVNKTKIHKNFKYVIVACNKNEVVLENVLSKELITLPIKKLSNFDYCHAFTCHSVQGISTKKPIVIFDCFHQYVTKNWLYVALTRNENMEVYYCTDIQELKLDFKYNVALVNGYREQDIKAGRTFNGIDFIDAEHIKKLSDKQKHTCNICKDRMLFKNIFGNGLNYVVDRIDNSLAHVKSNTQLLCTNCNCRKK